MNLTKKREVIKAYVGTGLQNKEDLILLGKFLGLRLNPKKVCKRDHQPPIDFVVNAFFENSLDCLVWGNRSGGKSFLAGFLTWIRSIFKPHSGTRILGGSSDQSDKAYKAMNEFWDISDLGKELLEKPPLMSRTQFRNKSDVEILTASQKSVRGPHQQNLILDEVEEMDEGIYEASLSQPQSSHNIPSSTIIMSTLHRRYGLFNKILGEAEGFRHYNFCVWEIIDSCRDYECGKCPLREWCPGEHVKDARGHYKFEDLIKKLRHLSLDGFRTEWLCERPSRIGSVYEEFDEDVHVIDRPFNPELDVDLGIDFGGLSPFVVCVFQELDDLGTVQVDEVYMGNCTNQYVMKEAKGRPWWGRIRTAYCDPSRFDLIKEWNQALDPAGGRACKGNNKVEEGITEVKNMLKPIVGKPTLYYHKGCVNTIREMGVYRRKGDAPDKKDDHAPDGGRYKIMGAKSSELQVYL